MTGRFQGIHPKYLCPPQLAERAPGNDRPRVLLECPPLFCPPIVAAALERDGFDVVVCKGPTRHRPCPLANGGSCGAVESVDVVLNMLDSRDVDQAEVLPALAEAGSDRAPVVAVIDGFDPGSSGVRTLDRKTKGPEIVAAVRGALDRQPT